MTPQAIKDLREKHYPSCRQAALAFGVDASTWSRWEQEGDNNIPIPQPAINWLKGRG